MNFQESTTILNACKPIEFTTYMDKQDLALNNLQWLICHKTKLNQIKSNSFLFYFVHLEVFALFKTLSKYLLTFRFTENRNKTNKSWSNRIQIFCTRTYRLQLIYTLSYQYKYFAHGPHNANILHTVLSNTTNLRTVLATQIFCTRSYRIQIFCTGTYRIQLIYTLSYQYKYFAHGPLNANILHTVLSNTTNLRTVLATQIFCTRSYRIQIFCTGTYRIQLICTRSY